MSIVCVPITAATAAEARTQILEAEESRADAVELRLDFLDSGEDWEPLLQVGKKEKIVTNRAAWEGGKSTESEDVRLGKIVRAEELGANYIDVELKAARDFARLRTCKPSATTSATPSQDALGQIYSRMMDEGADICKIAVTAQNITDCLAVFNLLTATRPIIAISMSERGVITRLLSSMFGSLVTFAAADGSGGSAPGQPSISDLMKLYRFRTVNSFSAVYGIVGNPVSHSMSPAIHNAAFTKRRMDAVYVPLLVDDFAEFLAMFRELRFKGCSITIPHKEAAIKCVDLVDDVAARIGAINTIVRLKDGRLKGYNTDWMAAVGAVERALLAKNHPKDPDAPLRFSEESEEELRPLSGKHVVLLGAGGAARGIAFGAVQRQAAALTVVNRTLERAQKLVDEMAGMRADCTVRALTFEQLLRGGAGKFDVVMNSTSIGMHPNEGEIPLSADLLDASMVVFDAVYNPRRTRLLEEAEGRGCTIVDGVEMFVGQALKQFELWTGDEAPRDVMEKVILERLGAKK